MLALKSTNESRVILIQMERWGLGKGNNSGNTGLCNQKWIVVEEMSLDIFNMTYRDEDSLLDQICQKQIFLDFYYDDSKY